MQLIVYIDMNAFFVSCHQAQNPKLKDKIVIVGSTSRRAIVCSASYEARAYNIRSAMPFYQAIKLCPQAICINIDRGLYIKYSQAILKYLKNHFSETIEQCSIDEYCFDITNIYQKYGTPLACAQAIQDQLKQVLDLPCSIGISFTKELAKIASKLKKPQGIAAIMPEDIETILWPLTVNQLNGIGPKTTSRLLELNIKTIGDLVNEKNHDLLNNVFNKRYQSWLHQAQGKTETKIHANEKQSHKSIGRDYTLEYDSSNAKYLKTILKQITKEVVREVLVKEQIIKTIVCGYKVERTHWKTKQVAWSEIIDEDQIYQVVLTLFAKIWEPSLEVRALRVAIKLKT